jgi:hypothetical protein
MKFISKNNRLLIVLQPGLPAEPLTGRQAVPQLSVRFIQGVAEVKDENTIAKMLNHPGFNIDFVCAEENGVDPYKNTRKEVEPAHVVTEMKYGHPEKSFSSPRPMVVSPEVQNFINKEVNERMMAFMEMITERLSKKDNKEEAADEAKDVENAPAPSEDQAPKKRMGRPPKKVEATNDPVVTE